MKKDVSSKYRALRGAGKLHGTIKEAVAKRKKRDELCHPVKKDPLTESKKTRRLRLTTYIYMAEGEHHPEVSKAILRLHTSRRKIRNWGEVVVSKSPSYVQEVDHGAYSSRVKYHRMTYHPAVQSYGILCERNLVFKFDGVRRVITAPHGYKWQRDNNGIKLVANRNGHEFHPTADDLLFGIKHVVAMLKERVKTRAAERKKHQQELRSLKRAEKEGVHVCLADSLKAGNCSAGTREWARRHGFDAAKHYTPKQVLAEANGDARRVSLVVAVALRRHRQEMDQGFCVLADHGK